MNVDAESISESSNSKSNQSENQDENESFVVNVGKQNPDLDNKERSNIKQEA